MRVQRLASPRECAVFEHNARERGRDDLGQQARQRWVELSAEVHIGADEGEDDALRRELWEALSAQEYLLGRSATATRQVLRRRGLVAGADQLVCKGDPVSALDALDASGLLAYAWEHVVLRHPEAFSDSAATGARQRLDDYELQAAERQTLDDGMPTQSVSAGDSA